MHKVLIVEDDLDFQKVLAEYFTCRKRLGYQQDFQIHLTATYSDAIFNVAISEYNSKSYDLVIIDYHLKSQKNGLNLYYEIIKINPIIPIIMLSGIAIEDFISATKNKKNIPKFLSKPFNLKELEQIWYDIKYEQNKAA